MLDEDQLKRAAARFLELDTEAHRAQQELNAAQERLRNLARSRAEVEDQLKERVGSNIDRRIWFVDTGVAVVAEWHRREDSPGFSTVRVLRELD